MMLPLATNSSVGGKGTGLGPECQVFGDDKDNGWSQQRL